MAAPDPGGAAAGALERRLRAFLDGTAPALLPLAGATREGGRIDPDSIRLTLLSARADGDAIEGVVGVLFQETVGGCSCGDDPHDSPRWCRLRLSVDGGQPPRWTLLQD
jgi:hypothetical protein